MLAAVVLPFDQRKLYGVVPLAGTAVAAPLLPPAQLTFTLVAEPESVQGTQLLPTVTVAIVVQRLASVTVTVYVPEFKLLMPLVVAPVFQR